MKMSIANDLKQHILVDGFHVVADTEKSQGSTIVDKETGKQYLDCYSQFASQALGWNHPSLKAYEQSLGKIALHKLANSDMYSEVYRDFVKSFSKITPDFKHYFFIDGGTLAVDNALKVAFDWKAQIASKSYSDGNDLNVVHLREAFHGRSGYPLSLTNTGELKTKWFPKFKWSRVTNPKIDFPIKINEVKNLEALSISEIKYALTHSAVAAIILEPIQGEGGDNHFRKEYLQQLRALADQYQVMLIFDEVQTGFGLTGKMWAYEHFGVTPDILVFGKKTQVCGIAVTNRVNQVPNNVFAVSGRINSTWGGNIVDMARATAIIDIVQKEKLVDNAHIIGLEFLVMLERLPFRELQNIRGRGLMLAFDLPTEDRRNQIYKKLSERMMVLKCGSKGIRFRPHLTFTLNDVNLAKEIITEALK